jgi:hypothetical protein
VTTLLVIVVVAVPEVALAEDGLLMVGTTSLLGTRDREAVLDTIGSLPLLLLLLLPLSVVCKDFENLRKTASQSGTMARR